MTGEPRRRVIAAIGLLLAAAALICAYFVITPRQQSAETAIGAADVAPYLMDGDVICRMGDRVWSSLIGSLSPGERRFSHLGIVRIRDGGTSVINAECLTQGRSESVNETRLPDFLALARKVGVYRANFTDGAALSDKAVEYLGRPFDWDFDLADESKIYCTELLYAVIMHIAPGYVPETAHPQWAGKPIVLPEAVPNSPGFDEVVYIAP
ncbi:MAG: hypothetical protein FWB85_03610 [Chitinispirillia bacterium]|nr:hypothetical protein [Chitinispirillia bacterium]MCL2241759.1 hypothetical protein [Chitinispirillia bacterium]